MGKSDQAKKLQLKKGDFGFCIELPIRAQKERMKLGTSKSYERKRISGTKKVNAFKDGLKILFFMIKLFFQKQI